MEHGEAWYSTAQGAGQALGPALAGYLIAAGRFYLAFAAAGLIGVGVPIIVAGWGGTPETIFTREPWLEFKRGVAEVGRDRLVLITSGAQAAQFVLNGTLNAFFPLVRERGARAERHAVGMAVRLQTLTTLAVRPVIGFLSIARDDAGSL